MLLCVYCKYDITNESFLQCLACLKPVGAKGRLCGTCPLPYRAAWCSGERHEGLRALIDAYKFERTQAAGDILADLLHETVPQLPDDTIVVAVPTVWPHIRQRGYDHMERVAKRFAARRSLEFVPALKRLSRETQRGATRSQRIEQAKRAFGHRRTVEGKRCLLVDDVFTTGASVEYAAKALRSAGASEVWVAVLSRQPLE